MRFTALAGWMLAIVLFVACVWLVRDRAVLREDQAAARSELDRLTETVAALAAAAQHEDATQAEDAPHEPVEVVMELAEEEMAPVEPAATPVEPEQGEAPEPEAGPDAPQLSEQQQRMLAVQAQGIAQMTYGDLFGELALAQETMDAVWELVQDATGKRMMIDQRALTRDPPWTGKEVGAQKDAVQAELRDALAAYLNRDELAAWDAYEAVSDQVFYEQLVGGQLAMMSPGLNEEARGLIRGVLGEELAMQLGALETVDDPYTVQRFADAQRTAMRDSADRLFDVLDEGEYADLQRYIALGEQALDALSPQE